MFKFESLSRVDPAKLTMLIGIVVVAMVAMAIARWAIGRFTSLKLRGFAPRIGFALGFSALVILGIVVKFGVGWMPALKAGSVFGLGLALSALGVLATVRVGIDALKGKRYARALLCILLAVCIGGCGVGAAVLGVICCAPWLLVVPVIAATIVWLLTDDDPDNPPPENPTPENPDPCIAWDEVTQVFLEHLLNLGVTDRVDYWEPGRDCPGVGGAAYWDADFVDGRHPVNRTPAATWIAPSYGYRHIMVADGCWDEVHWLVDLRQDDRAWVRASLKAWERFYLLTGRGPRPPATYGLESGHHELDIDMDGEVSYLEVEMSGCPRGLLRSSYDVNDDGKVTFGELFGTQGRVRMFVHYVRQGGPGGDGLPVGGKVELTWEPEQCCAYALGTFSAPDEGFQASCYNFQWEARMQCPNGTQSSVVGGGEPIDPLQAEDMGLVDIWGDPVTWLDYIVVCRDPENRD